MITPRHKAIRSWGVPTDNRIAPVLPSADLWSARSQTESIVDRGCTTEIHNQTRRSSFAKPMSIQSFLRAERYDLSSDPATLDRRLLREAGPERADILQRIWASDDEEARLTGMYGCPRTVREAHLLLSHDRLRIIDTFRWIVRQAPFSGTVVDLGCGTGTLVRLLADQNPNVDFVGVDAHANLIDIGSSMADAYPTVQLISGDFTRLDLTQPAGTMISVCGVECLDQPDASVAEEKAAAGGTVPKGFAGYARERIAPVLGRWRSQIQQGGRLLLIARLSSLSLIAATIRKAAAIGFLARFDASTRLRSGTERIPVMTLIADEPGEADMKALVSWV